MNKYEIKIFKEYCKYDCQTSELIHKYMYENKNKFTTSTQYFYSKGDRDKLINTLPIVECALKQLADMAESRTYTIEF